MKIGRNDPCLCKSGKKFKHCCIDKQTKHAAQNNASQGDYYGVPAKVMSNWLFAPFNELEAVVFNAAQDFSASPVMRYLGLIVEEALQNKGTIKATAKGNLPAKLVKQASELLPEFAVATMDKKLLMSEYTGSNENNFRALHYTRVLAEIAGIIKLDNGRYQLSEAAQQAYLQQGVSVLFEPMLKAAVADFNWGYFDQWELQLDLSVYWVFMVYRLQQHGDFDQLIDEMLVTFPDILKEFELVTQNEEFSPEQYFASVVRWHFIEGFLQYWGFVTFDSEQVQAQPLLAGCINFSL